MKKEASLEQWKRLFEKEGVSPSDLAKLLGVPPPRISDWLSRKRICQSTIYMRLWTDVKTGEKKHDFQLVEVEEFFLINKADDVFGRKNTQFFVGKGLYGVLQLFMVKNDWQNETDSDAPK